VCDSFEDIAWVCGKLAVGGDEQGTTRRRETRGKRTTDPLIAKSR
jgi:hypothetical protein